MLYQHLSFIAVSIGNVETFLITLVENYER